MLSPSAGESEPLNKTKSCALDAPAIVFFNKYVIKLKSTCACIECRTTVVSTVNPSMVSVHVTLKDEKN